MAIYTKKSKDDRHNKKTVIQQKNVINTMILSTPFQRKYVHLFNIDLLKEQGYTVY